MVDIIPSSDVSTVNWSRKNIANHRANNLEGTIDMDWTTVSNNTIGRLRIRGDFEGRQRGCRGGARAAMSGEW